MGNKMKLNSKINFKIMSKLIKLIMILNYSRMMWCKRIEDSRRRSCSRIWDNRIWEGKIKNNRIKSKVLRIVVQQRYILNKYRWIMQNNNKLAHKINNNWLQNNRRNYKRKYSIKNNKL